MFRQSADQGLPSAFHALGTCYDQGKGVQKNAEEAVKCFLRAAKWNVAEAQVDLGMSYFLGQGVEKNPSESYAWFILANKNEGNAKVAANAKRHLDYLENNLNSEILTQGKNRAKALAKTIGANLSQMDKGDGEQPGGSQTHRGN